MKTMCKANCGKGFRKGKDEARNAAEVCSVCWPKFSTNKNDGGQAKLRSGTIY